MVLLVTGLVSGLFAMHVLISGMGTHNDTQLSDSAMAMEGSTQTVTARILEAHAANAHTETVHMAAPLDSNAVNSDIRAALTPDPLMSHPTLTSSQCSNGCSPVHSMAAMACVLTLSAPVLLFAASQPPPAPVLSTDRLPELALALAAQTVRAPEPPDLNVLSVWRT